MPWIIGGAILGGAVLGGVTQSQTNKANRQIAGEATQFSAESAAKQMEFQERMSSTAHQREMADLAAGGLNPILSAKYGGASTPSGSIATPTVAKMENPWTQASSALMNAPQGFAAYSEGKLKEGQSGLLEAQRENIQADTIAKTASAGHLDAMKDNIRQDMTLFEDRWRKLHAESKLKTLEYSTEKGRYDYLSGQKGFEPRWEAKFEAELHAMVSEARKLSEQAKLLGLQVPEALASAALWTDVGEVGAGIKAFGGRGLNAAKQLWMLGRGRFR